MTRPILGLLMVGVASLAGLAQGRAPDGAERIPVLVELFTSEGCNSCPPADRILEMLSKAQPIDGVEVLGLSEHVTYWDHQGWKDPFGSRVLTQRQDGYAVRFKLESMFTPQVVVDGTAQMVGSDSAKLKSALADAARTVKPRLIVGASVDERDGLVASASGPGLAAGAAEGADLWWAVTEDDLVVDVLRGENAKRTLRHAGVVRTLISRRISAAASAMGATIRLRPEWKREHLRLVAFVQSSRTKRVISVGSVRLTAGG